MPSNKTTLYFVQSSEFEKTFLKQAFDCAKFKELDVELLRGEKLLENGVDDNKVVFVTDEFAGDVFELLLAHKKRIFGPQCILQCVLQEIPLPSASHPVHSLAMSGATVVCTGIVRTERQRLKKLIEHMNGVFVKDFSDVVTHLIAGEIGSEKYSIAADLKKPIVLSSWVETAWQQAKKDHQFDATEANFVDEHRCPIFKGCSVCVTGLDSRRRNEIKKLVEENGGTYCRELKLNETTHLLAEKPVGQKYHYAKQWSLHCVVPNWLFECIEAGCWLKETSYLVIADNDVSIDSLSSTVTAVDATINSTAMSSISTKAALAAQQSAASHGRKKLLSKSCQTFTNAQSSSKSQHVSNKDETCGYDISIPNNAEPFLDGCRLYLTGFSDAELDCLQKVINVGGATRFDHINPSVSHIVFSDKPLQDIEKLVNSEFSPHVVKVQWLLDSCQQLKCLPEQEYSCLESNVIDYQEGMSKKESNNENVPAGNVHDENEILKQYIDLMQIDDQPSTTDVHPELTTKVENEKDNNDTSPDETIADEQRILDGLKFCLAGFSEEQEVQLEASIEDFGGSVIPSASTAIADFLVVPMNIKCEESRAKVVVTYCYLERCLESGELLEPSTEFLFTPFSLPDDVFPLEGCVVSVSLYTNVEREHLVQLIEVLGGHYQEYFSRNDRADQNLLRNTQLIVKEPVGSKYFAAVDWGIPAVGADWLFACARTGCKVSEDPYILTSEKSAEEENKQQTIDEKNDSVFYAFPVPESKSGPSNCQEMENESIAKEKTSDRQDGLPTKAPSGAYFGEPKRPSLDLTDVLQFLQSPCVSSGSSSAHSRLSRGSRNSFLMDDFLQEHLQAALKTTGTLLGPHKDHDGSTVDRDESHKEESPGQSCFLHGVVLAVTKKISKQWSTIHTLATSAGAECRDSLDKACTHLIHEGRTTREQNQAKSKGVQVVSPHWLYDSSEQQCRLDESLYPPQYNPKFSLSVIKTRRSTQSAEDTMNETMNPGTSQPKPEMSENSCLKNSEETTHIEKEETQQEFIMDEFKQSELDAIAAISQSSAHTDSLQTKEELKYLNDLIVSMKSHRRRSSRTRNSGNSSHSARSSESECLNESKFSRRSSSRLRSLRSSKNDSDKEDGGHAMDVITYDDPKSRQELERIIAKLDECSPNPEIDVNSNKTFEGKQIFASTRNSMASDKSLQRNTIKNETHSPTSSVRSATPTAPSIALHITSTSDLPEPVNLLDPVENVKEVVKPIPKFVLSSMSQQEKIDYAALIEELGGVVFEAPFVNQTSGHIIAGNLSRNEKILSSIAAGNWVLRKSYMEACREAKRFVDEQPHEWAVKIPGENVSRLAQASQRWRIELTEKSGQFKKKIGAFQDWKVVICIEKNRVSSFTRMLKAGGAEVIETEPPFQNIARVTHAFISPSCSLVKNINFGHLEQAGILVLKTDYIIDFLTENPPPATSKYVVRSVSMQSARKRKQNDSNLPETPEKKQRGN